MSNLDAKGIFHALRLAKRDAEDVLSLLDDDDSLGNRAQKQFTENLVKEALITHQIFDAMTMTLLNREGIFTGNHPTLTEKCEMLCSTGVMNVDHAQHIIHLDQVMGNAACPWGLLGMDPGEVDILAEAMRPVIFEVIPYWKDQMILIWGIMN